MLHSKSGYAEQDCVFATPYKDDVKTIWQIIRYDPCNFKLEFVRFTPNETILKINIQLESLSDAETKSHISYQYTGLNENQNSFIETELPKVFLKNMEYWENAINHYLKTNQKMVRE